MHKGVLPPKVKRANSWRSCPAHRAWVRKHHCSVPDCKLLPIECAHVRRGTDGGTGLKPSDRWTISLCAGHHRQQHDIGEQAFEHRHGIDLSALAEEFWRRSPIRLKLGLSAKSNKAPEVSGHTSVRTKGRP